MSEREHVWCTSGSFRHIQYCLHRYYLTSFNNIFWQFKENFNSSYLVNLSTSFLCHDPKDPNPNKPKQKLIINLYASSEGLALSPHNNALHVTNSLREDFESLKSTAFDVAENVQQLFPKKKNVIKDILMNRVNIITLKVMKMISESMYSIELLISYLRSYMNAVPVWEILCTILESFLPLFCEF